MAYIPNTVDETREMLATIGVEDVEELFSDVPDEVKLAEPPAGVPEPLSELEMLRLIGERAGRNKPAASSYSSFLGAGAYEHFIPSAVQALAQRGEFLTAYTPYQAEGSQGTLQVVYEFQTMICRLTGMEVANASMYDGASALAEAVLMAVRVTGRNRVLLPLTLHPSYWRVVQSYTHHLGLELIPLPSDETRRGAVADPEAWPKTAGDVAAVVVQHPNFWGYLEPAAEIAARAREMGALTIAVANPMSLSVLEPPGTWGADIAVGEAQPIGLPMNYGGPYAGYMATLQKHIRKMPGRIVGRTRDKQGREAFVLTLQTREQHIRRERATSNICTNQGLCAAMVTFYLALIGREGFERLGDLNLDRAGRLHDRLIAIEGIEPLLDAPFFNEFTVRLPIEAETFYERMRRRGVLPGVPAARLGASDPRLLIVCATETKTDGDLDRYIDAAPGALEQQG